MFTPWGYEVDELPAIVTVKDYNAMTGGLYAGDARLEAALDAASAAVRNVCGWHVAPNLECSAVITPNGKLARIPAALVTEIVSVTDGGEELGAGEFEARQDGLIRRCGFKAWRQGWGAVAVRYRAGFELAACADLADVISHIVEAALNVSQGVASETAGNVSISYMADATATAGKAAIAYAPALAAYRLVSSHAA